MSSQEFITVLEPKPLAHFVETKEVKKITERALGYIKAGFPIHFRGVSGTGKTTLAMHVASKLGRSLVMIHGDEEHSSSDLIGGEYGYRVRKVVDNFIHSVLKAEEDMQRHWVDNRLTVACKYGFTLIYDEFTRSRPEANNTLLSVLQEKMLDMTSPLNKEGYLRVNPDFTAIFTSNPEEYAGVYRSQDALRDRMITMDLEHFNRETEIKITKAKSGLSSKDCSKLIDVLRKLRESGVCEYVPTIRSAIMIGKTIKVRNGEVDKDDPIFKETALEILTSATSRIGSRNQQKKVKDTLKNLINHYCVNGKKKNYSNKTR
ncbi:MAG TPA: gas vesicle protein GvpN [Acidobacteriota bacterium]|nr:gas vesicle protein GvpN [Acidobacteriota bacterium]